MSTEELVAAIQAGAEEHMGELWEQVRRYVAMRARRVPLEGRADCELDDLIQAGYLALADAVASYEPGEHSFLTHLSYHLKTQFAIATRFRSERQQRETLAGTVSLDALVSYDESATTLMDYQSDPTACDALEDVEQKVYLDQLREVLEMSLAAIPEDQSKVLRCQYYQNKTIREIAENMGMSHGNVHNKIQKALSELRKPERACYLRPFYTFDFYHGTGLQTFRSAGLSIQERYMILTEDKEYMERMKQDLEREKTVRIHNRALDSLINEITSQKEKCGMSTYQLSVATGICIRTLSRRLEDPDGMTLCELWKLTRVLQLDPGVVTSAIGCTGQ